MDILSLFITVPLLTIVALLFTKQLHQARLVALAGSLVQVGMAINLVFAYVRERAVNDSIMVFTKDLVWFEPFNIHYTIGVDGISVALLVLTAMVVLAGVFISWRIRPAQGIFYLPDCTVDRCIWFLYLSRPVHHVRFL